MTGASLLLYRSSSLAASCRQGLQLYPANPQPSLPLAGVGSNSAGARPAGGGCGGAPAPPCRVSACQAGGQQDSRGWTLGKQYAAWAKKRNATLQQWGGLGRHVTMLDRAVHLGMQSSTWNEQQEDHWTHRRRMNLSRTRRASTSPKTVLAQGLFHSHPPLGETRRSPQSCRTPSMVACSAEKDRSGQCRMGGGQRPEGRTHLCRCPKHAGRPAWWAAAQTWKMPSMQWSATQLTTNMCKDQYTAGGLQQS